MAVSAAFPGLIGPYVLDTSMYKWLPPLYSVNGDIRLASDRFEKIHLYDGGVYDNLGLEAFFDVARGPKIGMDGKIIVSDAGAPLPTGFNFGTFDVFRLKHVADIMADQVHSKRPEVRLTYASAQP
jgi:NTE family protein